MLFVRTFGGLETHLHDDGMDKPVPAIGAKRVAMLAYLAVTGPDGPRRRDTLLAMFWPELDQNRGRRALRQALYAMRAAVGDQVVNGHRDEQVSLESGMVWCDAVESRAALADGRPEQALELYRGPFLEGFHVSGCPEFERWVDEQRRELRDTAQRVAWQLSDAAAGRDPALAMRYARRATTLDPDDEASARRLIQLLDRVGDRAGAVREYDRLAAMLMTEHDVEPAPETQALIAEIKSRTVSHTPDIPAPRDPAASRSADIPLSTSARPTGGRWWHVGVASALIAVAAFATLNARRNLPTVLVADRIAVAPFQNLTDDTALDRSGLAMVDLLLDGIPRTGVAEVVGVGALPAPSRGASTRPSNDHHAEARDSAMAAGAATLVTGTFIREPTGVAARVIAMDVASGAELTSYRAHAGPVSGLDPVLEELRSRIMGFVAMRADAGLRMYVVPAQPPVRYEAYRTFREAMTMPASTRARQALAAHEIDPGFVGAVIFAIAAFDQMGETAVADSLTESLAGAAAELTPPFRHLLEVVRAERGGDRAAAYAAAERVYHYLPAWHGQFAWRAFFFGAYDRVVAVLEPRATEPLRDVSDYKRLAAALHFLGEHEREVAAAAHARRAFPADLSVREHEVTALAAMGDTARLGAVVAEALQFPNSAYVARVAGTELLWHDFPEPARRFLELGLSGYEQQLYGGTTPGGGGAPSAAIDVANTLLQLDRYAEAQRLLRATADSLADTESSDAVVWRALDRLANADTSPIPSLPTLRGPRSSDLTWLVVALGIAEARLGNQIEAERLRGLLATVGQASGLRGQSARQSAHQAMVVAAGRRCEDAAELLARGLREGYTHPMIHRRTGFLWCRQHPAFRAAAKPPRR